MAGDKDRYQALSDQRSTAYGDPRDSHRAIGLAWEGVFRNRYQELFRALDRAGFHVEPGYLFPEDLTAHFMAAFKVIRAARPVFHQDSYDDGHVYLGYSEQFRKEDESVDSIDGYDIGRHKQGNQEGGGPTRPDPEGPLTGLGDPGGGSGGGIGSHTRPDPPFKHR